MEETFANGNIDGKVTIWYENGSKDREGVIRGTEPEGIWQYWNNDGSKDFIFDYGKGLDRVLLTLPAVIKFFYYLVGL